MTNDNLLRLAKVIGLELPIIEGNEILYFACGDGQDVFNPYGDNDQFVEVFEWLTTIGYFEHLSNKGAGYKMNLINSTRFCSGKENLKQNVINIAVQVAKYLEPEK